MHVHDITADGKISVAAYGNTPNLPIVNYANGAPADSGTTLPLSSTGKLTIKNTGAPVDVAIDVEGYFTADSSQGVGYSPIAPVKYAPVTIAAGGKANIDVGDAPGLPSDYHQISGLMLSLASSNPTGTGNGYLRVYETGLPEPDPAILSWNNGTQDPTSTSAVITPNGNTGEVTLSNVSNGSVTITVVAQGWFSWARQAAPVAAPTIVGHATVGPGGDTWVDTYTPSVAVAYQSPSGSSVDIGYSIVDAGSVIWSTIQRGVPSGQQRSVIVPAGVLQYDQEFAVNTWAVGGGATSELTPTGTITATPCEIFDDTGAPSLP